MNHKLAGCPRTWHSLWDEMFSASAAFEIDAESAGPEHESSDATVELQSWIAKRAARQSNDNGAS